MEALILEDERSLQEILKILLEEFSFNVTSAYTVEEAQNYLKSNFFDIALIDLRLPDGNGMEIAREIKKHSPETEIVIITAFASAETIKEAFELGVYDYIEKPFKLEDLRLIIRNLKDKVELKKQVGTSEIPQLIGKSPATEKLKETIRKIAPYDVNVLITGESGTGKEVVARAIHNLSNRNRKPFIAINCAALPSELLESELFGYKKGAFTGATKDKKGLIETANGGTLFLDEIGDMPIPLQAKLLRFLETKKFIPLGSTEEREVNVRIIAATNKNLKEEVKKGNFREDLFYRLSTIQIHIPPLRERKEDIPLLVDYFVKQLSKKYNKEIKRISQNFINYLMNQPLEGNVRELKNIVEREVIMCDDGILGKGVLSTETTSSLLPPLTEGGVNLKEILKNVEKEYLLKALELAGGKKTKAAELLGLTFREFRYRLSKLNKLPE
ncbi:two-component system, NtrC family, response regulator PilR [Desulfurobacterium pacificum]|uniref:Two-component system, NtrC family, response regulator PilR n=1 Tax=Desulfurobacterium pacificum TaxID=240166 RepID=A0ABY1NV91_9BACT|nr:sigma-54 dependent transcriptional regulator [Desulfurobacterium pacificum]SMP18469.1 two-component system, NtrC family, response regulator PilR [Desulfurobacterium pacificum]